MNKKKISDQVIRHIMTVGDEGFANLSVGSLAYSFKIDRSKLSRQFKRHTNMTLENFLFKEKMVRAAFLLKVHGEHITVKQVSEMIGYCTCDYFIRKFKEFYGIAPGTYKSLTNNGIRIGGVRIPPQHQLKRSLSH